MGAKTHEVLAYKSDRHHAWLVWCPACDSPHSFDERWTFDGNHERPTFSPSMLVRWRDPEGGVQHVCHSFLRAGVWQFLDDCTHALRGVTAQAPDWANTRFGRMRSDGVVPAPDDDLPSPAMAENKQTAAAEKPAPAADKAPEKAEAKPPATGTTATEAKPEERPEVRPPPPANPPAVSWAPPVMKVDPEQERRRGIEAKVRAAAAVAFKTFQGPPLGLTRYSASLLCAHLVGTTDALEDVAKMGRTEALAWAEGFQRQCPVAWFPMKNGDLNGFCKMLTVQGAAQEPPVVPAITRVNDEGKRVIDAEAYRDIASVIGQ